MAKRKKKQKQNDELLVDLVEQREQAQDFIDRNGSYLFGGLAIAVLLFAGWFAYNKFVKEPNSKIATEMIAKAEAQFARDSFQNALSTRGEEMGLIDIVEQYGSTNAGNAANIYTAISYLRQGEFKAAISYAQDFDADTELASIIKNGVLGDAYSESGDLGAAKGYYASAASSDNTALTPFYLKKLGFLNMKNGDNAAAKAAFEKIKNYPGSSEYNEADKLIGLLGN